MPSAHATEGSVRQVVDVPQVVERVAQVRPPVVGPGERVVCRAYVELRAGRVPAGEAAKAVSTLREHLGGGG